MSRKTVIVLTLFAMAFSMAVMVALAHAGGPDVITIDKAQAKKPPVVFPHKEHQEEGIDCVKCHHTAKGPEDAKSCFECHGKDANAPTVKDAFHGSCIACHKEMAKGPTKCKECHT